MMLREQTRRLSASCACCAACAVVVVVVVVVMIIMKITRGNSGGEVALAQVIRTSYIANITAPTNASAGCGAEGHSMDGCV